MDIIGGLEYVIATLLSGVVKILVAILPTSPFAAFQHYFSEFKYLKYINYFLPVDIFLSIMEAWLLCIALWYVWCFISDIMGWVSSYRGAGITGGTGGAA